MAARGSESKEKITQKILEVFPGSFIYEKEVRIPMVENGEVIQIKAVLTAAKTNVECGDVDLPGVSAGHIDYSIPQFNAASAPVAPTEEEKQTVQDLLTKLGLC